MHSERTPAIYYSEILRAIRLVEEYVGGLRFETVELLREKQDSVLYRLLVLTEAAHRLSSEELSLCPNPNWRRIRDLGNVLRHAYDSVDFETIWLIVHEDLPPLKLAVEQTMREHFPDVPRSS